MATAMDMVMAMDKNILNLYNQYIGQHTNKVLLHFAYSLLIKVEDKYEVNGWICGMSFWVAPSTCLWVLLNCFSHQIDTQAKDLIKSLQKIRSPVAKLLEERVALMERCQILAHRKIKSLAKGELTQHLAEITKAGVQLSLRIRLDVFERLADETVHDLFHTVDMEDSAIISSCVKYAGQFVFWEADVEHIPEINENIPNIGAIWASEEKRLCDLKDSGEITQQDADTFFTQASEASFSVTGWGSPFLAFWFLEFLIQDFTNFLLYNILYSFIRPLGPGLDSRALGP